MRSLSLLHVTAGNSVQTRCLLFPSLITSSRRTLSTSPVILEENSEPPRKAPIALDLGGININPAPALTFAQRLAARRAAQAKADEEAKAADTAASAQRSAPMAEKAERLANIRAHSNTIRSAPRLNVGVALKMGQRDKGSAPWRTQEVGDKNSRPRRTQEKGDTNFGQRRVQTGGNGNYGPRGTREGGDGRLANQGGMNRPHDQLGLKPQLQGERRPFWQRTGAGNVQRGKGKYGADSAKSKGRNAQSSWKKKWVEPEAEDPRQGDPDLNDYAESGRPTRIYNAEGFLLLKGKHMQVKPPIPPRLPRLSHPSAVEAKSTPVASELGIVSYADYAPLATKRSNAKRGVVNNAQLVLGRVRGLNMRPRVRAMEIVQKMAGSPLADGKATMTRVRATA
ncbi:hypothetical protein EW145_g3927 [Phellinidium pouzarii]|uniref:Uncharacterized protein n=1 Tax=Phellinidium pouzarii TaxID=167371 RepID=A0A4V3XCP4_9AGAM|nr:hypothetical protein EW145_g3927 [Phellinidium pouzarii]